MDDRETWRKTYGKQVIDALRERMERQTQERADSAAREKAHYDALEMKKRTPQY